MEHAEKSRVDSTSLSIDLVTRREEEYSYSFCKGGHDVHTAEFYDRVTDDGCQRGLLGIVG